LTAVFVSAIFEENVDVSKRMEARKLMCSEATAPEMLESKDKRQFGVVDTA
jgi:hypothetical protein